jgi:hypothetical protein
MVPKQKKAYALYEKAMSGIKQYGILKGDQSL